MPNPSTIEITRILASRIGFQIEEYRDDTGTVRYRRVADLSTLPRCSGSQRTWFGRPPRISIPSLA
jgi:hypothetical protein